MYLVNVQCRNRSLLPVSHALIDLLLLAFWIWHAAIVLDPLTGAARGTRSNVLAAYAETESIGWDPAVYSTPDRHFALMLTGTLPAGMVSYALRPEAGWQTHNRLWDPVWLLIHEAVAIPFWFLLGAWLDTGRSRLLRTMRAYLALRLVLAVMSIILPAHTWWIPQFLFWIGLGGYALLHTLHGLTGPRRRAARV
jgi:hypothetical protein